MVTLGVNELIPKALGRKAGPEKVCISVCYWDYDEPGP